MKTARTYEIRSESPERIARSLLEHYGRAGKGAFGLLFLGGALGKKSEEIARELADAASSVSWVIAAGTAALTERGEREGEPIACAMVLDGYQVAPLLGSRADGNFGKNLGEELRKNGGTSAFLLLADEAMDDYIFAALGEALGEKRADVFGAGAIPAAGLRLVTPGKVEQGKALALLLRGPRLYTRNSAACRLLSPLLAVTKTRGSMLLELDGMSALTLLAESTKKQEEQLLVLLAVASGEKPLSREGRSLTLRPIHGVDPSRGGLLLPEEMPLGTLVAFAVRDAHAARIDLEAHCDALRRDTKGSAASFGIYLSCSGRGQGLYGTPDVDVRILRGAFPEVPFVGLHSLFELATVDNRLVPQIYSGVLGLFASPS